MLFTARASTAAMAGMCRRLATTLGAGVDLRTAWTREVDRARGRAARARMEAIHRAVQRGDSLRDALGTAGDYFPPLFLDLVEVGDKTGHLSEALGQLAEHYEEQIRLRHLFVTALIWPMVQLGAAIVIVGFLIWIMGVIRPAEGPPLDPLGLGLSGERGLAIYVAIIAAAGLAVFGLIHFVRRGVFWARPIQRLALRIPVLGQVLQTLALARLAWSLHLTFNAGMDVRRAVEVSLRSTQNARYTGHVRPIQASIAGGDSLYEAFLATRAYPPEFLDALHVGEQTGRVVESMAHLSRQYHERADVAMKALAVVGAFAVWACVAAIIVALIFRLFFFYIGIIYDAMPP